MKMKNKYTPVIIPGKMKINVGRDAYEYLIRVVPLNIKDDYIIDYKTGYIYVNKLGAYVVDGKIDYFVDSTLSIFKKTCDAKMEVLAELNKKVTVPNYDAIRRSISIECTNAIYNSDQGVILEQLPLIKRFINLKPNIVLVDNFMHQGQLYTNKCIIVYTMDRNGRRLSTKEIYYNFFLSVENYILNYTPINKLKYKFALFITRIYKEIFKLWI